MNIKPKYDDVEIPEAFQDLIEDIAEDIHHSWVQWKLSEGFVLAGDRDYKRKQHPHLRHWKDLPPYHKASDYLAAGSALKVLIGKGLLTDE